MKSEPDSSRPDRDPHGYLAFHELARRLRAECPWDVEQTHLSLVPYLIEETYEVVDAIAALEVDSSTVRSDVQLEPDALQEKDLQQERDVQFVEELGDLLYQIEFHAAIAEEQGRFTIADVTSSIHDKLVRRHPHVFGDDAIDDPRELSTRWEEIKRTEKPERTSALDGVAASLPALSLARETQRKAARSGFDWESIGESAGKVREELVETLTAADETESAPGEAIGQELGDLLFAVVNLARHLDVDPESALRAATHKFARRFRSMEREVELDGAALKQLDRAELERRWASVKAAE